LGAKHLKVKLTLIKIQSEEQEPGWEKAAIHTLVSALHEAYIRVKEEREGVPGIRIGPGPSSLDFGLADVTLEIRNCGRLSARIAGGSNRVVRRPRGVHGSGEIKVDERTTGWIGAAAGDRFGVAAGGPSGSWQE
jgi:hypothetical protein